MKPDFAEEKATWVQQVLLAVFVIVPFLAVPAGPVRLGLGPGLDDVVIFALLLVSGLGITVGLPPAVHPRLVQGEQPLRIALAIAGSMAIEGPVIRWVATTGAITCSATRGRSAFAVALRRPAGRR